MKWLTEFADYFRNIPAAFLVAIFTVLGLILFLPDQYSKTVAIDGFRDQYRVYLGPTFLFVASFCVARIFTFFRDQHNLSKATKERERSLHNLTPEEKGYLACYVLGQQNSIYVGVDDGVMAGLRAKGITYLASGTGSILDGFAFNLQPWAREYLEKSPELLKGAEGRPLTPRERNRLRW